ncbi:MAG: DUF3187 family protein [Planctomycetota bacterium]
MSVDRAVRLINEHRIVATPTMIVLDASGRERRRAVGLVEPDEVLAFLAGHGDFLSMVDGTTQLPLGYRLRSSCFTHASYGPIDIDSQAPGNAIRQSLPPRTPSTLGRGQWEARWTETFTNIWSDAPGRYRLDYGTLESRLTLARGLTESVQLELEISDLTRTNSALDPITNAYHDLFGLDDAGRDEHPSGDNEIFFAGMDGAPDLRDRTSGSVSRDLSLTLTQNLTCGTEHWPAVAYSLTARYHTGGAGDLEGPRDWSFGGSISASRRISDRWYVYGGLGYLFHGPQRWRGLELESEQLTGLLAVEWDYAAFRALTLQYLWSDATAVDRSPFDEPAHEFYLGWKRETTLNRVWEFGLIENGIVADNSPDFGLHVGVRQRW